MCRNVEIKEVSLEELLEIIGEINELNFNATEECTQEQPVNEEEPIKTSEKLSREQIRRAIGGYKERINELEIELIGHNQEIITHIATTKKLYFQGVERNVIHLFKDQGIQFVTYINVGDTPNAKNYKTTPLEVILKTIGEDELNKMGFCEQK